MAPDGAEARTIEGALEAGTAALARENIPVPRLEARMILAHVLGWEPSRLLLHPPSFLLTEQHFAQFHHLLGLRARRMPIQYVLGRSEFYSLEFRLQPGVLIPRPETEQLVDQVIASLDEAAAGAPDQDGAIRHIAGSPHHDRAAQYGAVQYGAVQQRAAKHGAHQERYGLLAADIGTGSGAVAVAAAYSRPGVFFYATDISRRALDIASVNAAAHGVSQRIRFLRGSWCRPLVEAGLQGQFHVVASNPPYVTPDEKEDLQPEVKDYEPGRALFTGGDGLEPYRQLSAGCRELLVPGGRLLLEVAARRAEAVARLLISSGWDDVMVKKDLAQQPRVVTARAPARVI